MNLVRRWSGRSQAISVLIADDESAVRRSLRKIFERDSRFEVVAEASNGAEAHRLVVARRPDVVVLDLAMGESDGLHAIGRISADAPATKIVVLSSMVQHSEAGPRARELGAHRVLDKFTPPARLLKEIVAASKENG